MKSKCCRKFKRKGRLCSGCPCHKQLGSKAIKKMLKKAA